MWHYLQRSKISLNHYRLVVFWITCKTIMPPPNHYSVQCNKYNKYNKFWFGYVYYIHFELFYFFSNKRSTLHIMHLSYCHDGRKFISLKMIKNYEIVRDLISFYTFLCIKSFISGYQAVFSSVIGNKQTLSTSRFSIQHIRYLRCGFYAQWTRTTEKMMKIWSIVF